MAECDVRSDEDLSANLTNSSKLPKNVFNNEEVQTEGFHRQESDLGIPQPRTFSGYSIASLLEIPNRLSNCLNDGMSSDYTELQTPIEESDPGDLVKAWDMNYHEAAIYLEEGENNDKFDYHPRSKDALPAYLLVHNIWFYSLDLIAAVMLMGLALVEKPAVPGFHLDPGIHASLELLGLFVVGIELVMKLRWMGINPFFKHKRSLIKLVALVLMVIESVVVIARQTNHFRISRALRPVYLIDNYHCGGIRRVTRQILQSLPPILEMLGLLLFFMLIFSVLGFYLFTSNPKDPYFSTLQGSFVSLFVLLTTANYPDVMMPAYAASRWSAIFFIVFLIIHLYFIMNMMLAVVYETFTRIEKDKFRKLLLHRRKACQHAFRLLVNRAHPTQISFRHFQGLMHHFKPKVCKRDVYLMFKTLDTSRTRYLTLDEFYHIYEVGALSWKAQKAEDLWFSEFHSPFLEICSSIQKLVISRWFNYFIVLVIIANGIWQVVEASEISGVGEGKLDTYVVTHHIKSYGIAGTWVSVGFIVAYSVEALLKIVGLGLFGYFQSGWNIYDFTVTVLGLAGVIAEHFNVPFSFVIILRPLRLLRLFKMNRRYRDVLGTVFIVLPRFGSVALVLLIVYYFFAIIGMELFSDFNMINCCKNTTVEQFYHFDNSSLAEGYYYLNNFENIINSCITLFELMVVNNWFIIMDGYAAVATEWSRIFFMLFYVVTMVVINIIIAFILEAFLFRIQYKRKMGDMDKDSLVRVDVALTRQELDFCYTHSNLSISQLLHYTHNLTEQYILYRGTRTRTKFSFSLKMYAEEVKCWLQQAEEKERQQREELLAKVQELSISQQPTIQQERTRRTFSV
ncbi:two pore calcium channel protein 1-like isoform X1 [Limulus polyphemus]|uniref:Two pore calcium channel protein 1-like isoform X1 n=1 Tax=Limulus polyphemus TaxID=6850 RepID=A0ABM1SHI5_LIMPO|nr:two pore calcium channel protein 1-like isoform X1 [Limulus polyphemus]